MTAPALRIVYLDDKGPLGIRTYPADAYPRSYETYELGPVGSIRLAHSLSEAEWAFLYAWLDLTKDVDRRTREGE